MADQIPSNQIDGECQMCGLPGVIGLSCSECGGPIVGFADAKSLDKEKPEETTDRYSDDDLLATPTESLEELAEAEIKDDAPDNEVI